MRTTPLPPSLQQTEHCWGQREGREAMSHWGEEVSVTHLKAPALPKYGSREEKAHLLAPVPTHRRHRLGKRLPSAPGTQLLEKNLATAVEYREVTHRVWANPGHSRQTHLPAVSHRPPSPSSTLQDRAASVWCGELRDMHLAERIPALDWWAVYAPEG
jgi:hypothetical protein